MPRVYVRALALLVAFAGAARAGAQAHSSIRLGAGIEQSAQRNPAESPYIYSGFGWTASLGYSRVAPSSAIEVAVAGGLGSLSSDVAKGRASHGLAEINLEYVRKTGVRLANAHWMVGGSLSGVVEATRHQYPLYAGDDDFGYFRTGFGAALRTTWQWRNASVTNDLAIPLVNLIDFPYSNAKAHGEAVRFSLAGPASLQAFDDAISYRVGAEGTRGVVWTYRVSVMRYRYDDSRRFARQSLSMAFVLGRAPR